VEAMFQYHWDLQTALLGLPVMILSLTVHEWAHAWSAHRLGDDTALREGRLTLNPAVHIDPIGTLLLPFLCIPFGWAKPVPVNPARFNRKWSMSFGMALTAAAGPLSNLLLAIGCAVALGLGIRHGLKHGAIFDLLLRGLMMNVGLAVFNMLPLPPLDGSRLADHFMPRSLREAWDSVMQYGPFILLALIAFGGVLLGGPIGAVQELFLSWVVAISRIA
jgi:Zn-dependent protease